jgi:hypothetical protein
VKITIPRMELVAEVILARLSCRVKESLKLALGKVRYFMDSSAILEMLKTERMTGMLKKQMQRSCEGKRYSHEGVCTLLQEAAQIINGRPILAGHWAED